MRELSIRHYSSLNVQIFNKVNMVHYFSFLLQGLQLYACWVFSVYISFFPIFSLVLFHILIFYLILLDFLISIFYTSLICFPQCLFSLFNHGFTYFLTSAYSMSISYCFIIFSPSSCISLSSYIHVFEIHSEIFVSKFLSL